MKYGPATLTMAAVSLGIVSTNPALAETGGQSNADATLLALDISSGVEGLIMAGQRLDEVAFEFTRFGATFSDFLTNLSQFGFQPLRALIAAIICVTIAVVAEYGLRRVFARISPPATAPASAPKVAWYAVSEAAALLTFALFVLLPLMVVLRSDPVASAVLFAVLAAVCAVRGGEAAMRGLFALLGWDGRHAVLDKHEKKRLYVSFVGVAAMAAGAYVATALFTRGGLEASPLLAFTVVMRALVTLALLTTIFMNRRSIQNLLVRRPDGSVRSAPWQRFAAAWHIIAACYTALSFLATSVLLLIGVAAANAAALWSFIILMIAIALAAALDGAVRGDDAPPTLLQDVSRRVGFPTVICGAVIALLTIWSPVWSGLSFLNISPPVRGALLQIGVTVFLTFVMWQTVNCFSEHYGAQGTGPDQMPGAGSISRFGTLVPFVKIMLLIGLAFVSAISALSSLGVDVLPLFAGAGIVGLAVGLGSQTLVKDVVSGIFFLIDDAFRIGEYVDLGTAKGSVESVSIRSMRLRHHLGTVHTIPYGEIRTVANMSRDWVIMRVEFGVHFDVDTNDLRKKINALGEELLADPELGPKFLEPLKSTGVIAIEESAMIVRSKYTARPGDQWEMRRRVYEEMRRFLDREGISVAVRQVHVKSPEGMTPDTARSAAGTDVAYRAIANQSPVQSET